MVWFGPQQVEFRPPTMLLDGNQLSTLPKIMRHQSFVEASVIKAVSSEKGAVLQVTKNESEPRRYFDIGSYHELDDADQKQAVWLATYYTGRSASDIQQIDFMTEFAEDYPEINRLLPVYRLQFAGEDELTAFVYTETNTLASLNNRYKQLLQSAFQNIHTLAWLNDFSWGRLVLIGLFMVCLIAMVILGLSLIFLIRPRANYIASRRLHRAMAYIIWLPILGWSTSGFYHLIQFEIVESVSGVRLGDELNLKEMSWSDLSQNFLYAEAAPVNSVSLVKGSNDRLLWRISFTPSSDNTGLTRNQRFDGVVTEGGVRYLDARTGELVATDDEEQAMLLASIASGLEESNIIAKEKIMRFGADYDFRNKRLPVWKVSYDNEEQLQVFVDPSTGVLVDRNRSIDRTESFVFGVFHKWVHLAPVIGRQWRDGLILLTLLLCLWGAAYGVRILLNNRRR